MSLLNEYKNKQGHKESIVNYTGYKGNFINNIDKISILMNACEKSVSSTVNLLINHPDIKMNITDPNGLNAIYYAVRNND